MVDLTFLQSFTKGNRDKMNRYISMYLQTAPEGFGRMQEALARQDWADLGTQAHALKPQAEFMGIPELRELLFRIEQKGKAGDGADMQLLLQQALDLHQQAAAELEAMIE